MAEIRARKVFYSGRVQGVGFRATVRSISCGFEVTGRIKNLPTGEVELVAQGGEGEVKAFLQEIAASALASHIDSAQEEMMAVNPSLKGFCIV